jgi:hypothetical protein
MRSGVKSSILTAVVAAGVLSCCLSFVSAQQRGGGSAPAIDPDDIGGVVSSAKGPEAGVWVIAETTQLPTKFARIVVTDDQGRYVVPDLPRATYQLFVRGYGLVDSARQSAQPGQTLNLTATVAPDAKSAAAAYPAGWWLTMLNAPQGAAEQQKFQQTMKECYDCHQLGNKATREFQGYVTGATHLEKWDARTKYGPSGPSMSSFFQRFGENRKAFADFTERVAKGEAPKNAPPRPKGVERNLVVSLWDWGTPIDGRADAAAADLRNPRITANGKIYGVSQMNDALMELDPLESKTRIIKTPTNAPPFVSGFNAAPTPSPNFGADMWKRSGDPRSVGIDGKGRVWFTLRTRDNKQQPKWCGGEGANKYGKYFPMAQSGKQVAMYDPKTAKFENVDTCYSVDHNELSHDNFIYYGSNGAVGWVDMDTWDKTHDAEKSQGWCPAVIDTNGDGKISTGWTEPDQPVDPARDHRVTFGCYSIAINEKDGSIWCSGIGSEQKRLTRITKGTNPPETCRAEIYEPPPGQPIELVGTGGVQADGNGIIYDAWRVSGHFTAFDRSKCKSTKDAKADGQSCPEGWTIYRNTNEPTYANSQYKASEAYLLHMDKADVLGFGKDAPLYGSMNTDSFELFQPSTRQFVTLRVPYPQSFFTRAGTPRIDDPNTGWKGRGFWASYATYASWHIEGGKGALPKAVKFQMRPNPLAK